MNSNSIWGIGGKLSEDLMNMPFKAKKGTACLNNY